VTATHGSRHFTSDLRLYVRRSVQVRRSACVLRKCSRRKFFRVCLARGAVCCIILSLQRDEGKFRSPFYSHLLSLSFTLLFYIRSYENAGALRRYFLVATIGIFKRSSNSFYQSFGLSVPDHHTNVDYKHGVRIKSFSHDGSEARADVEGK